MITSLVFRLMLCILLISGHSFPAFAQNPTAVYEQAVLENHEPPEIGHYVKVTYRAVAGYNSSNSGRKKSQHGELLAISADYIYLGSRRKRLSHQLSQPPRRSAIRTHDGFTEEYHKIPIDDVILVKMDKHSTSGGDILWMTFGGMILSISNGLFLIITMPLWLITGIIASIVTANTNDIEFRLAEWSELNKYARYPQGIPAEIKEFAVLL
mgnify:CR=1 FL=1